MKTLFIAVRALFYMMGFVFVSGWVVLQVGVFDFVIGGTLPPWTVVVGVILMIAGGVLGLVCVGVFVIRGKGTAAPFDAPIEFVAVGPYRYVRNPMYIGGLTMLVGFGCFEHSLSMVVFSVVWLFAAHCFVIYYEERTLERRFGESYLAYKKKVNRWLPRPG